MQVNDGANSGNTCIMKQIYICYLLTGSQQSSLNWVDILIMLFCFISSTNPSSIVTSGVVKWSNPGLPTLDLLNRSFAPSCNGTDKTPSVETMDAIRTAKALLVTTCGSTLASYNATFFDI